MESKKKSSPSPHNGVMLSPRQVSIGCSLALFCGFIIFMCGYFWGNKNAVEQFNERIQQESLGDHIYFSLCRMYDTKEECSSASDSTDLYSEEVVDSIESISSIQDIQSEYDRVVSNENSYYAQLAGFSTQAAADKLCQRLQDAGYMVHVESRKSKSVKGREISWFQVVSSPMRDKLSVERIVNEIKKKEKIHNSIIVCCKTSDIKDSV